MATHVADTAAEQVPTAPDSEEPRGPRRRWKVAAIVGAVLLLLVVAAALWFFLGRDRAEPLTADQALTDFRAANGDGEADTAGRPAAGVYAATASGTESIGLPGFDEELGPDAPVTVTHGEGGCYTYRADFNSHHWRSWTFCPTDTATFALTELDSWTARKAPGLDIETLTTYRCDRPLDFLWDGAATGDTRDGACTGTTDMDDSVTADAGTIEVLDATASVTIDGETVAVVHARTTDTFSGDQTGTERGEWWLDATTGLPVKFAIEASVKGPSDYSETPSLELSTLTPAT